MLTCSLKRSRAVQIPVYSFTQHQRTSESTYLYGHAVIVVEGIFVLQDKALRDLLDMKIFVHTDPDIMLARRIRRDTLERGRSVDGVLDQYLRFVKPSFDTFVGMTAKHADIIVPGANNEVAIDVISQHIAKHLTRRSSLRSSVAPIPPSVLEDAALRQAHAQLLLGTTAAGRAAHVVDTRPFRWRGAATAAGAVPRLSRVNDVVPLPPNVRVVEPTAQLDAMLTQLHDTHTPAGEFAFACKRIGAMLVETAMALLPYRTRTVTLSTGGTYDGVELDVRFICGVSILRSGAVLEPALRRAFPALSLGSLLIQSSDSNRHPLLYVRRACIADRAGTPWRCRRSSAAATRLRTRGCSSPMRRSARVPLRSWPYACCSTTACPSTRSSCWRFWRRHSAGCGCCSVPSRASASSSQALTRA